MIGGTGIIMSLVCGRNRIRMAMKTFLTVYQKARCSSGWMQQLETGRRMMRMSTDDDDHRRTYDFKM